MKRSTYWKYALESPRGPTGELVELSELGRRPAKTTLLPSRINLSLHLLVASLFTAIGVFLAIVLVSELRQNPEYVYPLNGGVIFTAILAVLFIGMGCSRIVKTFRAAGAGTRITFEDVEVLVERRQEGQMRSKRARYDSFLGVRVNTHRDRSEETNIDERFVHIIELAHEDEFLTIPLYSTMSGNKVFNDWPLDAYAEALNVPVMAAD